MKDRWSELAGRVRKTNRPEPEMPFGFEAAVLRRLNSLKRSPRDLSEAWLPLLRPALGLAFATAVLCVVLQAKMQKETPINLLTETESLIQLAVLQ